MEIRKNIYGPKERGFFDEKAKTIKAYSEKDYTLLPDPVRDPIVTNNIVDQEFDYTNYNDDYID